MNDIIKMSIVTTIQALTNNNISFEYLWELTYRELETIRDREIINYNNRVKK